LFHATFHNPWAKFGLHILSDRPTVSIVNCQEQYDIVMFYLTTDAVFVGQCVERIYLERYCTCV